MLTPQQIATVIAEQFGPVLTATHVDPADLHPRVHLSATDWLPLATFLRSDPAVSLDWLACLSGVDYAADGKLAVVYDLRSVDHGHAFAVKVFVDRSHPHVPTVTDLWPGAVWHEREAYDLLGITFDGLPDPRRILLADDWVGHPLRKDYVFPTEYHGISAIPDPAWQNRS